MPNDAFVLLKINCKISNKHSNYNYKRITVQWSAPAQLTFVLQSKVERNAVANRLRWQPPATQARIPIGGVLLLGIVGDA